MKTQFCFQVDAIEDILRNYFGTTLLFDFVARLLALQSYWYSYSMFLSNWHMNTTSPKSNSDFLAKVCCVRINTSYFFMDITFNYVTRACICKKDICFWMRSKNFMFFFINVNSLPSFYAAFPSMCVFLKDRS